MKLEKLKMANFRGFRELEIKFDPSFTVLLGPNMAGKTAVLDGAAVALGALLSPVLHAPIREIDDSDVHRTVVDVGDVPDLQRQWPTIVDAHAVFAGTAFSWTRARYEDGRSNEHSHLNSILKLKKQIQDETLPGLPIIAQYGVQRTWPGHKNIEDHSDVGSRQDGYKACFNVTSTHDQLAGWMRRQTFIQLQRNHTQPQLAAVAVAVKSCIDDVLRFWFDIQYEELRLERIDGDIQSFGMLSEGYRNMVAMVADIAWRAAVLNPQHGPQAHLLTEGVVLIDELDLHLHPAWQRRVVGDLRRTFPKIQFIVTTHSPQIVASVSRSQIRLLDRNQLIAEEPYVEGRNSNEILEDVFGVPSRPENVQAEIDALYRLIEDEDFAAARTRLAALQERLGPDDTAMIKARWILETEDPQQSTEPPPPP